VELAPSILTNTHPLVTTKLEAGSLSSSSYILDLKSSQIEAFTYITVTALISCIHAWPMLGTELVHKMPAGLMKSFSKFSLSSDWIHDISFPFVTPNSPLLIRNKNNVHY
jgi:hypothetical protein